EPGYGSTADGAVVPQLNDRAIWLEVVAVLAIGVLPNLLRAMFSLVLGPSEPVPYWLDAMYYSLRNSGICVAALYIIWRSGETWTSFGLARPRLSDLGLGLGVLVLTLMLWIPLAPFLSIDRVKLKQLFPVPNGPADFMLMVLNHAANGFAEELVNRAYLVTRLERLLNSPLAAVILSAVVFSSYHVYYGFDGAMIWILMFGLMYALVFLALRRVWPLAIGHMLINIYVELRRH